MISFILTLYSHVSHNLFCVFCNHYSCHWPELWWHQVNVPFSLLIILLNLFSHYHETVLFPSWQRRPFDDMFVNKPNNIHDHGLGKVTLNMAETAFVKVQQKIIDKNWTTGTRKCSLQSQTKEISLSDNSEYLQYSTLF